MSIYIWQPLPSYTVNWKNWDNTVLETDLNVDEGTTPTYNGATPTRSGYTFSNWSPTPAPIYANTNYIAQFNKDPVYDELVSPMSNRYSNETSGSYFYGMAFTAKNDCKITKVRFMYWTTYGTSVISGTLKIATGMYLNGAGTTYSISSGQVSNDGTYVLPQPFQLTAGTYYSIGIAGGFYMYPYGVIKECTNITYNCTTNTYDNTLTTQAVYLLSGLYTE